MDRPLIVLLAALMLGISAAVLNESSIPLWSLFPATLLFVIGWTCNRSLLLMSGLSILFLFWGNYAVSSNVRLSSAAQQLALSATERPVSVTGVLDSRPEPRARGTRLYVAVESVESGGTRRPFTGRLLLYVGEGRSVMLTGDRIRFVTRLREPRNLGLPGEYDYRRFLALQNIFVTGFVADPSELELIQEAAAYPMQRGIDSVALWLGGVIDHSVPSSTEAGILKALLVGERGSVPQDIEGLYARTGVNHILSISGFHVSIIALVLYHLLARLAGFSEFLLRFNLRRVLLLATLPVLVSYLFISGAAPATTRSVLMVAACFLGLLVEREGDLVNLLALAALVILAICPQALFELSFQLSFLAFWGILVLYPLLVHPFEHMRKGVPYRFIQFCAVSVAAIAATMIPVAYHFHRFSVIGLASNFIVVPLLGYGAVVAGFTGLVCAAWAPFPAKLLIMAAALLVRWSNQALYWLDRLPQLPHFTPLLLDVLLAIALMTMLTLIRSSRKRLIFSFLLAGILCWGHLAKDDPGTGKLRVTLLSMGQAESTLIRFPDGSCMLVDGGGSLHEGGMDAGERLLAPALWSMGINRIDWMVLSHSHPDHVKGLLFIASAFPVGEFWESGYSSDSPAYLELKRVLASRGVPVRILDEATRSIRVGGAVIEPLAPPMSTSVAAAVTPQEWDVNDESLVFRLSMGRFSMLFTGDSGFTTEARLLRDPGRISCSVLKVAHHGSRHSSSVPFLRAVSPSIALISAGYRNNFHLPAHETVADLERIGAQIYRTDRDGSIELTVNPASGAIVARKISGPLH